MCIGRSRLCDMLISICHIGHLIRVFFPLVGIQIKKFVRMPVEDLAQQGETSVCNTYNTWAAQAGESQVNAAWEMQITGHRISVAKGKLSTSNGYTNSDWQT